MWTVIKFDKKNIHIFKEDLKRKLGNNFEIYYQKLTIQKYQKQKLKQKNINLLGDYLFCFHSKFQNERNISQLKFIRGVKYFLNGFRQSQIEINNFIINLKKLENEDGYITQNIYQTEIDKIYKFTSGPFTEKIFKIISLNKDKIDVLIGNIKSKINKKKFLFKPV